MSTLLVVAGLGIGIAALAVLVIAFAFLIRAVATLLPPASQFMGDVQNLREWSAQRVEQERRRVTKTETTTAQDDGLAPAPVFEPEPRRPFARRPLVAEGPTSADLPPVVVGDVDRFDAAAAEEFVARPLAAGSRHADKPPGPPIQGEEGF